MLHIVAYSKERKYLGMAMYNNPGQEAVDLPNNVSTWKIAVDISW